MCLPSFRRGERIETALQAIHPFPYIVSPRFDGGSGLKHERDQERRSLPGVSPRFDGGSGLKQYISRIEDNANMSPLVSTGGAD